MKKQQVFSETEDGSSEEIDTHLSLHQSPLIREVWAHNFKEEIQSLAQITQQFNIIALDTQFPGVYTKKQSKQQKYKGCPDWASVRENVQRTKLIQVGLTLTDSDGRLPYPISTWQFNFNFDLEKQNCNQESIQMLIQAGVNFSKCKEEGILHSIFSEGFMSSGLPLNKNIKWVVFHGVWDCAYLLRLLRNDILPSSIQQSSKIMRLYFPWMIDLKTVIMHRNSISFGLSRLGQLLECSRVGAQHQAGSDSLLTLKCYVRMIEQITPNNVIIHNHQCLYSYWNFIYGIEYGMQQRQVEKFQYIPGGYHQTIGHNNGLNFQGPLYEYLHNQQINGYNLHTFRKY